MINHLKTAYLTIELLLVLWQVWIGLDDIGNAIKKLF